jgi:transposase
MPDKFLYELLIKIRAGRNNYKRPVMLFMDNALIYLISIVIKTILGMRVFLIYTHQYSPQLNPLGKFFKYVKSSLRGQPTLTKKVRPSQINLYNLLVADHSDSDGSDPLVRHRKGPEDVCLADP